MKKNFLFGGSAFVLAIASIFVVKANAKFIGAPALYVSSSAGCQTINTSAPSSRFTETSSLLQAATIVTAGGTGRQLYYTSSCNGAATTPAYVAFAK
jgi:hypothetical protein